VRLRRLWVEQFKNLHDFEISFSESAFMTIVGRNGTGKSNVLELLTVIFRDLDLGMKPATRYVLSWESAGHSVEVQSDPDGKRRYRISVDGENATQAQLTNYKGVRLLPRFVFGYYSGPGNRMEEHFLPHQRRFYRELLEGRPQPLRPLFYARPVHAQFVLLSFFLDDSPEIQRFLRSYLRVTEFESALFVLKQPDWTSKTGDARFWNARGTVAALLSTLYDASLAPMKQIVSVETGLGRSQRRDRIYLYLPSIEALRLVRDSYNSDQDFFKALESMLISNLLDEVQVRVRTEDSVGAVSFRELSEGEQQLLMVLGLLRFTREEESLLLLDEPDTHLNPAWSVEYRRLLMKFGGTGGASQVLLVTHDPLVIADQTRDEVRILERRENGAVVAARPEDDPRGQGVAGLLTSDIYGLESELDPTTRDELARLRVLATMEFRTPEEEYEFAVLGRKLRALDMASSSRDPLYFRFAQAMMQRESSQERNYVLTPEAMADRKAETDRVLDEILGETDDW
jgi:predicted ATPase